MKTTRIGNLVETTRKLMRAKRTIAVKPRTECSGCDWGCSKASGHR